MSLVIDASIAGAATEKEVPTSRYCRDFLLAVLEICHKVVMTPELLAEWKRHRTSFARKWLRQMYGRNKVVMVSAMKDSAIEKRLSKAVAKAAERQAVLKDVLLLKAAFAADRLIASRDDTARRILSRCCSGVPEIADIVWVNPVNPEEEALSWLKRGAPAENARKLGNESGE